MVYSPRMSAPSRKSPIERLLSLFAEVQPGEATRLLFLTLNIFLILTSYLIAKTVREPLILGTAGAEWKSYSAAGQVLLLSLAIPAYGWLYSRIPRQRLVNYVTVFFVSNLVLFYLWGTALPGAVVGVSFFLWVGIFSLVVISQFWSLANDIYTESEGKRLFAIVAFGQSLGGVMGPLITSFLLDYVAVETMLLISAGILVLSLVVSNVVLRRERATLAQRASEQPAQEDDKPSSSRSAAFQLVFRKRYLLLIALFVLLTNWVNTNGEYVLGRVVTANAEAVVAEQNLSGEAATDATGQFIGQFYGDFFSVVGIVGLLLQLFIVARLVKWIGVRWAILILPLIALGGYALIAAAPALLVVIRWAKTAENATDYSLNNTVRQMLFLPTSAEEKYKAKVAIDSFFHRAGDILSAGVVFIGTQLLTLGTSHFALINIALVVVWLVIAWQIGGRYRSMTDSRPVSAS